MRRWVGRLAAISCVFLLLSACASHAPSVDCDKRLAPINLGEKPNAPTPDKKERNKVGPKS